MRHLSRMAHQALDTAERLGQGKEFKTLDECADGLLAPVDLKAHHAAKTTLLLLGQFMTGMRCETRVKYLGNVILLAQNGYRLLDKIASDPTVVLDLEELGNKLKKLVEEGKLRAEEVAQMLQIIALLGG